MKRSVGILIFDGAEVLDFAGPFEVFSVTSELNNYELFEVFTIGKSKSPIKAINGLSVNPKYAFDDCPPIDILIIAGGSGTNALMQDSETLDWIAKVHPSTQYMLSICSGSRMLGKLGLLDNQSYCTHHLVYDDMHALVPSGNARKDLRFVQAGRIFTSGGISAGIDLSFHLVEMLHGNDIAQKTADYMEYRWGKD